MTDLSCCTECSNDWNIVAIVENLVVLDHCIINIVQCLGDLRSV